MRELPWTWVHEAAFRIGTVLLAVVIVGPFVLGMVLFAMLLTGRL
jgi:diacylglycerol kinase